MSNKINSNPAPGTIPNPSRNPNYFPVPGKLITINPGDADGARTSPVTAGEAGDDDAADARHTDATCTSGVTASAGADEAVHDTVDGDADESNDTDAPATGVGNVTDTRDVTDTMSSSKIKPKLHATPAPEFPTSTGD